VQSIAAGQVASLTEGRSLVGRSVETRVFEPADPDPWGQAYERYVKLKNN